MLSIRDGSESGYLAIKKQYQMQFNGTAIELPGIATNFYSGAVNEIADIPISSLGNKIFRPYLFRFTSRYAFNAYQLINENPRGYIQFTWGGTVYKGFIWKISYKVNQGTTDFALIAHPDTTNDDLLKI